MKDITTEQIHRAILFCNAGLIDLEYFKNKRDAIPVKHVASKFDEMLRHKLESERGKTNAI